MREHVTKIKNIHFSHYYQIVPDELLLLMPLQITPGGHPFEQLHYYGFQLRNAIKNNILQNKIEAVDVCTNIKICFRCP